MNFFWDLSFSKRLLLTDDASLQTRGREETLELSFYPLFRLVDNKTKGLRHKSFGGEGGGVGFADVIFRVERSDDRKYVCARRLYRSRLFNSFFVNEKF